MRNFLRITAGLNTVPVLNALAANPQMWNEHDLRTRYPQSPHHAADDILLRFNELDAPEDVINDIQTHPFDAWFQLPVRDMVLDLMRAVGGTQLGRALITRLAPGASITPHADGGAPATFYERYQVMLQCLPGVVFRSGDETVQMQTGDVWWFNNTQEHEVVNNSADDRIVLIADIRTC